MSLVMQGGLFFYNQVVLTKDMPSFFQVMKKWM